MSSIPPIVFVLIFWLTVLGVAGSAAAGFVVGGGFLIRRPRHNGSANYLFALLIIAMSATLISRLLGYTGFARRHPHLAFLPIYYTLSFGPLLFFFVKSRLFSSFRLRRNDVKHFILPVVQPAVFLGVSFQSGAFIDSFRDHFFSPFYGNFEKAAYIASFFLYLYFSYRFIRHERMALSRLSERKNERGIRLRILVAGWLKRMVKALFILFGVHAFFLLTDYFSYKLFDINLNNKALFNSALELSFAAMVCWLAINGFFAWRRGL